jgi:hypothetical protein
MRNRKGSFAAVAAVAVGIAGCGGGTDDCPRTAGIADSSFTPGACQVPATTLTITMPLCEQCSHTTPNCTSEVLSTPDNGLPGEIFLSTQWEICADNNSCSAEACANVTCTVTVPVGGAYDVAYIAGINPDGSFQTPTFEVTFGGGPNSCI